MNPASASAGCLRRRPGVLTVALAMTVALVLVGCGGSNSASGSSYAAKVAVIRGWAQALRRGDVKAAAGYFALPSLFANSAGIGNEVAGLIIRNQHEAQEANASLSCGAVLLSARPHGRFILATFRLVNRTGPGAGCGTGVGDEASTAFIIRRGRIADWLRAPDVVTPQTPLTVPTVPTVPPSEGTGSAEPT